MKDLSILYVARAQYGLTPVERFVQSLCDHAPKLDWELVVAFKGYGSAQDLERAKLVFWEEGLRPTALTVPERGYDIGAYKRAAKLATGEVSIVMNSRSRPAAGHWADALCGAVVDCGMALAGATGSWERMRWQPPFPNYHLRTTGLALRTEDLRDRFPSPWTKLGCYAFEAGWWSLTRDMLFEGKEVAVIGADGVRYPPVDWAHSGTFRQGRQENLLVRDRQTDFYDTASAEERLKLERMAWGEKE